MAPSSANALYVLRLVLASPHQPARRFSTAVLAHASTVTLRPPATAPASSLASVTHSDFLETEDLEYSAAAAFLPERPHLAAPTIPWPTLFHHETSSNSASAVTTHHPHPCDLLARLVVEGNLDAARRYYDELRAVHVRIRHRHMYLNTAVASLAPTKQGRADFLFWLELYPNRPATRPHPELKKTWLPVVFKIVSENALETQFLADFLILAGRKGLLPVVLPSMISVLAAVSDPSVSIQTIERAITAYVQATTSATSTSLRAQESRNIVRGQVNRWWNLYLRALSLAGWRERAQELFESPPAGVQWSLSTFSLVSRPPSHLSPEASIDDPMTSILQSSNADLEPLAQRLKNALDPATLPSIANLAMIQRQLERLPERASLLGRFKRRFCRPPSTRPDRVMPTLREKLWWHAEIYALAEEGKHDQAIRQFREKFIWAGLPDVPALGQLDSPRYDRPRLVPNVRVVTTVLKSVLELLPKDALTSFHASYLAQLHSLPPSLQPSPYTHFAVVRVTAHKSGPTAALAAINEIVKAGIDPGSASWNALLLSLFGRGETDAAHALLEGMELGMPVGDSGITIPPPSARSYAAIIRLLMNHGRTTEAQVLLRRFKVFLASQQGERAEVEGDEYSKTVRFMRRNTKKDRAYA